MESEGQRVGDVNALALPTLDESGGSQDHHGNVDDLLAYLIFLGEQAFERQLIARLQLAGRDLLTDVVGDKLVRRWFTSWRHDGTPGLARQVDHRPFAGRKGNPCLPLLTRVTRVSIPRGKPPGLALGEGFPPPVARPDSGGRRPGSGRRTHSLGRVAMTDISIEHRRGIRRCVCGQRHTRNQLLYIRDQQARVVHPADRPPTARQATPVSGERADQLRRTARLHSQDPRDATRCLAPSCRDRYPCEYRRVAIAEIVAAGIADGFSQ